MTVKRHPVMGFFAGLFLGLGIALMMITMGIVPLSAMWLAVLTLGGAVLGVALAYVVPARGRKTVQAGG
jgi:hypothetical protein